MLGAFLPRGGATRSSSSLSDGLVDFGLNDFTFGTIIPGCGYNLDLENHSLRLVVVPEPSTTTLLLPLAWGLTMRRRPTDAHAR